MLHIQRIINLNATSSIINFSACCITLYSTRCRLAIKRIHLITSLICLSHQKFDSNYQKFPQLSHSTVACHWNHPQDYSRVSWCLRYLVSAENPTNTIIPQQDSSRHRWLLTSFWTGQIPPPWGSSDAWLKQPQRKTITVSRHHQLTGGDRLGTQERPDGQQSMRTFSPRTSECTLHGWRLKKEILGMRSSVRQHSFMSLLSRRRISSMSWWHSG